MTVDHRTVGMTAMLCAMFVAGVALAIAAVNLLPGTAGVVRSGLYFHTTITLTVALAVMFGTVLVVFVYIGVADRRAGRTLSTLYLPLIAEPLCLFIIFGLAAISGLDREWHGLKVPITGRWNQTPAVQLLEVLLFYSALLFSYGWLVHLVLTGRGWRTRGILGLYAGLAVAVVGLVGAAALL